MPSSMKPVPAASPALTARPWQLAHPLWQCGFRPFFVATVLFCVGLLGLWLLFLAAGWPLPGVPGGAVVWHVHELLMGATLAAVAGFALTAVPEFTDTPSFEARHVRWLLGLWLLGRLSFWLSGWWPQGLLALSGWDARQPLLDPFCGSGTLVIEAAQILCDHAPGLNRHFGIEQLRLHDAALYDGLMTALRERARQGIEKAPRGLIRASDLDPHAMRLTAENLQTLGLPDDLVAMQTLDAVDAQPGGDTPGVLLANPPYNERVSIPVEHWRAIGATLRERFGGWKVFLLTSDRGLPGQLGLREDRKTPLFNGAIECRLFEFSMRQRG